MREKYPDILEHLKKKNWSKSPKIIVASSVLSVSRINENVLPDFSFFFQKCSRILKGVKKVKELELK